MKKNIHKGHNKWGAEWYTRMLNRALEKLQQTKSTDWPQARQNNDLLRGERKVKGRTGKENGRWSGEGTKVKQPQIKWEQQTQTRGPH